MKHTSFKHIVHNSFLVTPDRVNEDQVLAICNMLAAITELNDEMLVMLFDTLDFEKIIVRHFSVDIVGRAMLNDWVHLYSYVHTQEGDDVEVKLVAKKNSGTKEGDVIVNGSFVFAVKNGVEIQYSLT